MIAAVALVVALLAAGALGFKLGERYGMREFTAAVQMARKAGRVEGREEMHGAFGDLIDVLRYCKSTGQPLPSTTPAMKAALAEMKAAPPAAD